MSSLRYLHLCVLLLSTLSLSHSLTSTSTPTQNQNTQIQFPCDPPHNSYPFCDTSLSISARSQSLLSLLTISEKISALCNNFSGIPRLGIPPYEWWSESLHGIAANGPGITFDGPVSSATMFPQVILSTASFNSSLWGQIASSIAVEARAMYNYGQAGLTFWAPNINIFRDPRWGRGQETPGEDPLVVSAFAVEYVNAFQSLGNTGILRRSSGLGERRVLFDESPGEDDGVGAIGTGTGTDDGLLLSACCKHFTAYDLEKWGQFTRYSFDAVLTEQDMEDTYQPPFKSCIHEGKASCLMCSYNSVNGIPACASKDLLQKARTEWGFNGYITSDCDAVATIYEYHNYTHTAEDAVAYALKAGTDINCGTYMLRHTAAALEQGKVHEEDINKAVLNLITVQMRLGLYDGNPRDGKFRNLGVRDVCSDNHKRLALEAARQGIVLLKNEKKFLPLSVNSVSSLAVIGPGANDSTILGGGYSGVPCDPVSYLQGLRMYFHKTRYASGCMNIPCNSDSGFEEANNVAGRADYVVVIIGLDLSQETEDMDRVSLLPPGKQMDLVSSIASVSKKPLILVITGGGSVDISFAKADPRIASILWVGYPGEAGGLALADIIFGNHNPGGRLPVTWYPESFTKMAMSDMNMRADPSRGYPGRTYRFYTGQTVFDFGYGLSYSSYKLKLISAPERLTVVRNAGKGLITRSLFKAGEERGFVHVDEVGSCGSLRFSIHISVVNEGDRDGSHVVMLFWKGSNKVIAGQPQKQLVGFSPVYARAYSSWAEAQIGVDPCTQLSFSDESGRRILPLGEHVLMAGDLEHSLIINIESVR